MASENDKNHRVRVAQYLRMLPTISNILYIISPNISKIMLKRTIWKSLIPTMMQVRAESVS